MFLVPPDDYQAITLVDLVERFNWTYISTVASEGSYGESGIEVVHREAGARNICIALAERVSSTADERVFDSIIRNLYRKPFARAVVLFTRADDARFTIFYHFFVCFRLPRVNLKCLRRATPYFVLNAMAGLNFKCVFFDD